MLVNFGGTVELKEGDHGPPARIFAELTGADGTPVTSGDIVIRVGTFMSGPYDEPGTHLLTRPMQHTDDPAGVWVWEPDEDDIVVGYWRLEAGLATHTLPGDGYGTLLVRPTIPSDPDGEGEGE